MKPVSAMKSISLTGVCALTLFHLAVSPAAAPRAFAAETAATLVDASPADLRAFENDADTGAVIPALQARMREASPAKRAALEKALLAVATDANAPLAGRRAACVVLAGFASDAAIAPLSRLLNDPGMSRSARFILEPMPGGAVDRAFLDALAKSPDATRPGVINSLGARRVAKAVEPLAKLARSSDSTVAGAAARALGAIGSEAALKALTALDPGDSLEGARADAILLACDLLIAAGNAPKGVAAALEKLREDDSPPGVRAAAWRLSIEAEPEGALERVSALLASDEHERRLIGAQALDLVATGPARESLVASAKTWPAESRALLIENLSGDFSRAVLPLARESIAADDAGLKTTSIAALGRIGDASDLDALFGLAADGAATREAALAAIGSVPDPAVNTRLIEEFGKADSAIRRALPGILVARSYREAIPALLKAGPGADRPLASETYRAIGALGDAKVVPMLLEQWDAAEPSARPAIERAIVAIGRESGEGEVTRVLEPRIASADAESRASAVRMAGAIGDAPALELLKPLITADAPDEAALRAVLAWQKADAIPVLQAVIARDDLDAATRQSAWRSLLRVSGETFRGSREESLRGFQTCMMTAFEKEDRALVVEALAKHNGGAVVDMLRGWLLIPGATAAADKALNDIKERRRASGRAR